MASIPFHPKAKDFEMTRILRALSDPVRLEVVRFLATSDEVTCAALYAGRPKSSMSHHFKILIDAGILRVRPVATAHLNSLRSVDLQKRFPGLIEAVLQGSATGKRTGNAARLSLA